MMIRTLTAALFAVLATLTMTAATAPVSARMQKAAPGIPIGAKAPVTMALRDSSGKPTTLASQMGAKGAVLVLVRSANWCPYCKIQLAELNAIAATASARGYPLVSLSYDKPETLAGFARSKGLSFTMLSDMGSKFIDAVRLRDPQYATVPFANGVPYATVLVIGKDGTVRAKNVSLDYTARPSNQQVLAMIPKK
jgi:peroxiredoxin